MTHVAVLVGSLRADSVNRQVAESLKASAPAGVEIEIVDGLAEVPFYNEDIDGAEVPAAAAALRDKVGAADRVLVVTPEYNATMPAVLNNAIDWLSRPYGQGAIVGKPLGVVGVTPTPYGGKWAHEDTQRSAKIAGAQRPAGAGQAAGRPGHPGRLRGPEQRCLTAAASLASLEW